MCDIVRVYEVLHGRGTWNLRHTKTFNEQCLFGVVSQLNAPDAEDGPLREVDDRSFCDQVRHAVQQVKSLDVANAGPPAGQYPMPHTVDLARRLKCARSHDAKAVRLGCRSSGIGSRHQPRRDLCSAKDNRHSRSS